ncbi:LysR substrate-binding domain-containing protein [uncultured Sphingomonas sp.]|mgnify:CR=1 FL=1|uniref:LysR substrate-binding domain-containing protein n=1 Tax=uncultured Sphingomonas sp. TaxID=158754 RepID=UPI0025CCBB39|nr:LysR substrate-binding domain-containing protein [uncultured Sphingomonas sp.]
MIHGEARPTGFTEELLALLQANGITAVIAQTVQEISTLFGLTAAGLDVSVLADSLRALRSANLVHRPLLDDSAITGMWLICRHDNMALPCRNFIRMIDERI